MAQYEEGNMSFGTAEMKTGKAAIAERKKKRREGQVVSLEYLKIIFVTWFFRFAETNMQIPSLLPV